YYFSALARFRKLIKKEKPNYIVSFGKMPNMINLFSSDKAIVRVDNFYSASCTGFSGWVYKQLVKLFFNRAEKVVVISKESAHDIIQNFRIKKEKVKVIYNPLNIEQIRELAKESLESEHKNIFKNPVIITMGQLGRQKNQAKLIKAFQLVKKEAKNTKLVILGQGPFENYLKSLAKELGLERDVYFLGWQKNPFKFIVRAKVFILSSLWEGLPCSLLESMACRIPVVSFDCSSGPREILAPGTDFLKKTKSIDYTDFGALVKPKDGKLMAEAIGKILSDNNLSNRLINNSMQRAMDFEAHNIIKEWQFLKH
ncbi:MAG: glycosyltransferase, partial [Patescibacteria group bacterium]